jgi:hypothetical protein
MLLLLLPWHDRVIEWTTTNYQIAFDGENSERVMHNEVRIVIIGGRDQAKFPIL